MKIGIFGGSFNPPHNMHKEIASSLIKQGYIDKVIFVPIVFCCVAGTLETIFPKVWEIPKSYE